MKPTPHHSYLLPQDPTFKDQKDQMISHQICMWTWLYLVGRVGVSPVLKPEPLGSQAPPHLLPPELGRS